jgi:hypothetical protein
LRNCKSSCITTCLIAWRNWRFGGFKASGFLCLGAFLTLFPYVLGRASEFWLIYVGLTTYLEDRAWAVLILPVTLSLLHSKFWMSNYVFSPRPFKFSDISVSVFEAFFICSFSSIKSALFSSFPLAQGILSFLVI